ncbi:glycoside hydrolase family 32 protein [Flavisericum labens]|uniref:glycoside hydrolase family 32 protein n=1 Tax=Flavisericum labens TaxID=3377112 RepID=UPI00387B18E7
MTNRKHNYLLILLFTVSVLTVTVGCKKNENKNNVESISATHIDTEERLYRPNFHFTPKANWMNDPNGMFYLNGKYHLYFQYYPSGNVWGPMHWGHAVSEDLITWDEKPIALYPDDLGLIFSGSAVIDKNNTSGFGKNGVAPIVAMFTYHNMQGEKDGRKDYQTQAIAYSLDEGFTWTKYERNPVIENSGIKDFRDPKVIWDTKRSKWVMALAAGDKVMFYSSLNLKDWVLESEFGSDKGAHGGVWECPDLFPMQVDETNETKWVLIVSINPGGPNGGSATQYFVGDFDGKTFTLDSNFSNQLKDQNAVWLDYGKDNYAGVTWSNIPESDGRKLFIGWMSNWDYARDVPTFTWRSNMTIARELKLKKNKNNFYLESLPVDELYGLTKKTIAKDSISNNDIDALMSNCNMQKFSLEFDLKDLKEEIYNILFYNKVGDTLALGLNNISNYYFLDRQKSGKVGFSKKFAPSISKAEVSKKLKTLHIQIILDKTSVEVFYENGKVVMTELFFPNQPLDHFSIRSNDKTFKIENLRVQQFE